MQRLRSLIKAAYQRLGIDKLLNYTITTHVNGRTVRLPKLANLRATITEPWMTEVLSKALQHQGGTFLDVGVNLGQTLVKVKSIDPERSYVGLEPNSLCVHYCRELVRVNSFKGCDVLPVGLFTENKLMKLALYSKDGADAAASLIEDFRNEEPQEFAWVPVYSYETLSKNGTFDDVRLVKIDVEGAELEVLLSLRPLLESHQPLLFIEVLPAYDAGNQTRVIRQEEIFDLLLGHGYEVYRIHKSENQSHSD